MAADGRFHGPGGSTMRWVRPGPPIPRRCAPTSIDPERRPTEARDRRRHGAMVARGPGGGGWRHARRLVRGDHQEGLGCARSSSVPPRQGGRRRSATRSPARSPTWSGRGVEPVRSASRSSAARSS